MHRPRQSNLLAPRSLTPSKQSQEHSPTTSSRSKNKLSSIVNMYSKNDHISNYDRGREILQQNYYLMGRLRNISDSKHKDSVHEKMRQSPQFVNSYCKYIKDMTNKNTFVSHNLSFEDRKYRYLEKMKGESKIKVIGTPSVVKKTIILPDISPPSTISVCPLDGNSEKTSINSRGYGNFSRYARSDDRAATTDRNVSPLLQHIDLEYKKVKLSPIRSKSTRKSDSEVYYEQKKYIFSVKNLKIREKMFFIELSQQKETQGDLFIFARDLKTTHLYTLRLKYSAAERILQLINYNYNELIHNLEFRNSKIVLTIEDPASSPHHTSKGDILTKVLEEKKSEEYNEDFESLTSFDRERKNAGHKQSQSVLAEQLSEF